MTATIRTTKHKHGYRVIRRVRLHRPQHWWNTLWTLLWSGGDPAKIHARQLRLQALAAEQHERRIQGIFLP